MGIGADRLVASLDALATLEPGFARGLERAGYPAPRISPRGYATLLRTIIGQQVSVASADAVWQRLDGTIGAAGDPAAMMVAPDAALRAAGLSRQKAAYARSLAAEVTSGALALDALPADDAAATAALMQIKGIGRWSAEIYLLFAEGRADIWPAGDLAVQIEIGRLLGLAERPSEAAVRTLADAWRPHRGAAAVFAWHHYGWSQARGRDLAPI